MKTPTPISILITVILFFFGVSALHSEEQLIDHHILKNRIEKAVSAGFKEKPGDGDLFGVTRTIDGPVQDEAWAILQLYKWKNISWLRLRWWESNDSENRILILVCLMNLAPKEANEEFVKKLTSKLDRLSNSEAQLRQQEISVALRLLSEQEGDFNSYLIKTLRMGADH